MSTLELSSKERSTLRAAAHSLKPVVMIGDNGLTPSVLKEIDTSLSAHGLIKVKVAGDDRANRIQLLQDICEELSCAKVHHLGKTLILYRHGSNNSEFAGLIKETESNPLKRKPNEVHTPKKLAAAGKKLSAPRRKPNPKRGNTEIVKPRSNASTASRGSHAIPRRAAGSALSLRAGRRSRSGS